MKILFVSLFLFMSASSFAGGFRWPNVEYDHAKLYLFNIPFNAPPGLDYDIYANGGYAKSKLGDGYDLSPEWLDEFHGIMARGVDALVAGLSECYIPRHGIIYFDKLGKPVASFSACFACERIKFWSPKKLAPFHFKEFNNSQIKKATDQSDRMVEMIKRIGAPHYDSMQDYRQALRDSTLKNKGEMFIEDPSLDSLYFKHYSISDVQSWALKGVRRVIRLTQTKETKISAGGDEWTYQQLSDNKGTRFIFSFDEENPFLVEATIISPSIKLPNGVSVGMSISDVMNTFPIYDGLAWPEHIQLKDKNLVIDYYFKFQTLQKITAAFSIV